MEAWRYPLYVEVYKGENRYLLWPLVSHRGGFKERALWAKPLGLESSCEVIGNELQKIVEYIKTCPLTESTPYERAHRKTWKEYSKYKSEVSFWKNNLFLYFVIQEDGSYEVASMQRSEERRCAYSKIIRKIELGADATAEALGRAVQEAFTAAEEFYKVYSEKSIDPYPPKEIALYDEKTTLTIQPPRDRHFEDNGDCGAAEIYQCYSYIAREGDEPAACFEVNIGPKEGFLDPEKIQKEWEGYYGRAESFTMEEREKGIFTHFAEMKNKKVYLTAYYLQLEDDWILGCEMTLYKPNKRKKLDEKFQAMFEDFVLGCQKKNDSHCG